MAAKLNTYFQTFKTDNLGQIFMTGILDVQAYNKVHVEIIQWPHAPVTMSVSCTMGKISGSTLAQVVGQFPLGTAGVIPNCASRAYAPGVTRPIASTYSPTLA